MGPVWPSGYIYFYGTIDAIGVFSHKFNILFIYAFGTFYFIDFCYES